MSDFIQTSLAAAFGSALIGVAVLSYTERIKATFIKETAKYSVQFKSYHELQVEYLCKLYQLLVTSRNSILQFTSSGQGPEWKDLGSLKEVTAYQDIQNAKEHFEKGQILVDEELCMKIEDYLAHNNKSFHKMWAAKGLANHNDSESYRQAFKYWNELLNEYPKSSSELLLLLRNKLRNIMEVK